MKFSCDNLGFRVNFILLQLQCRYNYMRHVFSIKKNLHLKTKNQKNVCGVWRGKRNKKKTFEVKSAFNQTLLVQFLKIVMLFWNSLILRLPLEHCIVLERMRTLKKLFFKVVSRKMCLKCIVIMSCVYDKGWRFCKNDSVIAHSIWTKAGWKGLKLDITLCPGQSLENQRM